MAEHYASCTANYPEKVSGERAQQLQRIDLGDGDWVDTCVDCGATINSKLTARPRSVVKFRAIVEVIASGETDDDVATEREVKADLVAALRQSVEFEYDVRDVFVWDSDVGAKV